MERPPGLGGVGGSDGCRHPFWDSGRFSQDVSGMPEGPQRNLGHCRAHSEVLTLPDDLSVVGADEMPSFSDDISIIIDMDKFGSATSSDKPSSSSAADSSASVAENESERVTSRHQHSWSMDGSTSSSIKQEMLASIRGERRGPCLTETREAMSDAKLAELALIDPKRARRIWANRQSAARSKERRKLYILELQRKTQILQTEAATLSAQLAMLQRDTVRLTTENNELKLHLQTMEQQVHLQNELNDTLKGEVQRLKQAKGQLGAGQVPANGGQMMSFGPPPFGSGQQFYHPNNAAMESLLAAHQLQQLQIHSQHQQQLLAHHNQLQHLNPQQQPPAALKNKRSDEFPEPEGGHSR